MGRQKRLTEAEHAARMVELRRLPDVIGECEAAVFVVENGVIYMRRADTGWLPDGPFGPDTPDVRMLLAGRGWLYGVDASPAARAALREAILAPLFKAYGDPRVTA